MKTRTTFIIIAIIIAMIFPGCNASKTLKGGAIGTGAGAAIGGLIGSEQNFATVGISFGLDVIYTAFELACKTSSDTNVDIYIIPIGTVKQALVLARALRNKGNRVEVELSGKKVRKAMERANNENVSKVIVLGEDEIANGQYQLRNMTTGEVEARVFSF